MVHPGFPGKGWDDFNCTEDRERELEVLCGPVLMRGLLHRGLSLATLHDI